MDALASFAKNVAAHAGRVDAAQVEAFLSAGYSKENLVDTVLAISMITVNNYLHNSTDVEIDFPLAPEL